MMGRAVHQRRSLGRVRFAILTPRRRSCYSPAEIETARPTITLCSAKGGRGSGVVARIKRV